MSQAEKPTGYFGRIQAKAMARGHKEIYKKTFEGTMPKKAFDLNFPLLNWLFERFPNAFPILRHILEL